VEGWPRLFDAAVVLIERAKKSTKEEMRLLFPTYYLLGHGIEVTLKAVLLEHGSSLDELKNVIRHDLNTAAERVVKLRLDPLSGFVQSNIPLVQMLNQYHSAKVFEYREPGHMRLPPTEELLLFFDGLHNLINRCLKK
jgi:hypothetical protein